MTDIDTAAIRADWSRNSRSYPAWLVLDLCDALDAARAELERERVMHRGIDPEKARYSRWWRQEKARTEAAERSVARWVDIAERAEARAEAAEARIAAALDVAGHDFYQSEAQRLARDVRRALTEGTGQ